MRMLEFRVSVAIPFVKTSACGNDFLIIDGEHAPSDIAAFTRVICDRHTGVGADGVEWLYPSADADVRARLINADGSAAEISGNGTRCVAAHLVSQGPRERVSVATDAGVKVCTLIAPHDPTYEFETDMGEPRVSPEITVTTALALRKGIPVSMGNPHLVIFVDAFDFPWEAEAAAIAAQPIFPQGVNIEWVKMQHAHEVEARFFERGAGATQSSGTGTAASAAAAIATGRAASPLLVRAPGGSQTVRWQQGAENPTLYLRGSAQLIARGEFFL